MSRSRPAPRSAIRRSLLKETEPTRGSDRTREATRLSNSEGFAIRSMSRQKPGTKPKKVGACSWNGRTATANLTNGPCRESSCMKAATRSRHTTRGQRPHRRHRSAPAQPPEAISVWHQRQSLPTLRQPHRLARDPSDGPHRRRPRRAQNVRNAGGLANPDCTIRRQKPSSRPIPRGGIHRPVAGITADPSGGMHLCGMHLYGCSHSSKTLALRIGLGTGHHKRRYPDMAHDCQRPGRRRRQSNGWPTAPSTKSAKPTEIRSGDIICQLGDEAGKARATRDGSARAAATWRTPFLSTGEKSVSTKMGERGNVVASQSVEKSTGLTTAA
jgi:hypothetical protein